MRLELGRRADYAIRAVVDLTRHRGEGRRRSSDIAQDMDIPAGYLPQVLADLVNAGIVASRAGPGGGHTLAVDPALTSLLDVLRAVDEAEPSTTCVLRGGPCRRDGVCTVHDPWTRAQQALFDVLGATTLQDVAAADRALSLGTLVLPDDVAPEPDEPSQRG